MVDRDCGCRQLPLCLGGGLGGGCWGALPAQANRWGNVGCFSGPWKLGQQLFHGLRTLALALILSMMANLVVGAQLDLGVAVCHPLLNKRAIRSHYPALPLVIPPPPFAIPPPWGGTVT